MRDPPPDAKITVEWRGQTVLIGTNQPQMYDRIDPEAFYGSGLPDTAIGTIRCKRSTTSEDGY